jgi:putative flippase GtrA
MPAQVTVPRPLRRLPDILLITDSVRRLVREVVTYGASASVALAVDVGLLALFVSVLHVHYLAAASASFIAGGVVLYALSVWAVFEHRRMTNHTLELSCFVALGMVGLFINAGVVWLAVEQFDLHVMFGKLLAIGCTFTVNFMLRRQLLFRPSTSTNARAYDPGL